MQSVSVSQSVGFQLKTSSQANSQALKSSEKFPPYNQGSVASFQWKRSGRSTLTMIGCLLSPSQLLDDLLLLLLLLMLRFHHCHELFSLSYLISLYFEFPFDLM